MSVARIFVLVLISTSFPAWAAESPPVANDSSMIQAQVDPKLHCVPPEYPRESIVREEEGSVMLAMLIDADGAVIETRVLSSSGYQRLDDATIAALRACHFKPKVVDGQPQKSWGKIKFTWKLAGTTSPVIDSARISPTPVAPKEPFVLEPFNVLSPDSFGWFLVRKSSSGLVFIRDRQSAGRDIAYVAVFPYPQFASRDEFMKTVKNMIKEVMQKMAVMGNVEVDKFEYTEVRGYRCVRFKQSYELPASKPMADQLVTRSGTRAMVCSTPARGGTGVTMSVSTSGLAEATIDELAEGFFSGVQLVDKKASSP